jgi:uncharacterized protein (TIGR03435 family)
MVAIVGRALLTIGESAELAIVFKATILLAATLVGLGLVPRTRASLRHVILVAVFGALIAIPVMGILLPPIPVTVPTTQAIQPPDSLVSTTVTLPTSTAQQSGESTVDAVPKLAARPMVSLSTAVRAAWILGVVLFLMPIARSLTALRRLRRRARPWVDGESLRTLALEVGIRRPIRVVLHEDVSVPITCGFVRPSLVFPADAKGWSDADIRRAIVHELEHVRRADWPIHLMARVACALYWFHPLVWTAWRRLCLEAERACDDAVLANTEQTAYADQLVRVARRLRNGTQRPALSMASRSDLAARIASVLDANRPRGRARAFSVVAVAITASIAVMTVSPLTAIPASGHVNRLISANELSLVGIGLIEAPPSRYSLAATAPRSTETASSAPTKPTLAAPQAPTVAPSRFVTASVTQNPAGMQGLHRGPIISATEMTWTGAQLRWLIEFAYNVDNYRLLGAPDWIGTDYLDLAATAPAAADREQFRGMLQKLLRERFNLIVHRETRDTPVYELVVADPNGALGPKLRQATADCATLRAAAAPELARTTIPCGMKRQIGQLGALGLGIDQLAGWLSPDAGRLVVDKTGLTGVFDWELTYTPEPLRHHAPDRFPQIDPEGPSIFAAVQEQLGLKLEPRDQLGEVLIVDHVDHPTQD